MPYTSSIGPCPECFAHYGGTRAHFDRWWDDMYDGVWSAFGATLDSTMPATVSGRAPLARPHDLNL